MASGSAARRAQGIGSRLVREACAEARALGEVELYLGTDGPGFYERLGVQRFRQLREDFWLMCFDLSSVRPGV
jgi:predicted N-acetyltransferase YhbS